jgi:hypothetical protein
VVDEALQAAVEASNTLGCILCGRKTCHVGIFAPDRGSDYSVPPGWRFVYRLCDDHLAEGPAVQSRVERHIWKHRWANFCENWE